MKTASRVIRKGAHAKAPKAAAIPPLVDGDRLTVQEFLRRYEAMPQIKKAELIEGVVHMPSPVSLDHGEPDGMLITWLGHYRIYTPGTQMLPNVTTVLDIGENCPQPDSCLRIAPECGGQSGTSPKRYIAGAPEWVGEVSATTTAHDLHDKLRAYQRNGVKEYVVWCVKDRSIRWFVLHGDVFRTMQHRVGVVKSKIFPGLWLDSAAMLHGDMVKVLKILHKGLGSEGHRRFVARLAKQKARAERDE
jgi:Uma2 family endonuclease